MGDGLCAPISLVGNIGATQPLLHLLRANALGGRRCLPLAQLVLLAPISLVDDIGATWALLDLLRANALRGGLCLALAQLVLLAPVSRLSVLLATIGLRALLFLGESTLGSPLLGVTLSCGRPLRDAALGRRTLCRRTCGRLFNLRPSGSGSWCGSRLGCGSLSGRLLVFVGGLGDAHRTHAHQSDGSGKP